MAKAGLWKPMLAAKPKPEDLDALLPSLRYPLLGSPKYDGIRCSVQGGRLYSRRLKPLPNMAMQKLWGIEELEGLDGEICVGPPTAPDCFNRSTSAVMSRDKPADGAVFYVFDMPDDVEPFSTRLANAGLAWDGLCHGGTVKVVRHALLKNHAALLKYEAKETGRGHEGIMLRDPLGAHKQGRSTWKEGGLIAVKRFEDAEAVVLCAYEQERNENAATVGELGQTKRSSHKAGKVGKGVLGGFTVMPAAMYLPLSAADKKLFMANATSGRPHPSAFNIGTGVGLTTELRAALWADRGALAGRIVKYRHQAAGAKDRPRIPVLLGFRDAADI